jgi:hypothetical protein
MRVNNVKRQLDGNTDNHDPFLKNKNCELQRAKSCDFLKKFVSNTIYNNQLKEKMKFNNNQMLKKKERKVGDDYDSDNNLNSIKKTQNCTLEKEPYNMKITNQRALDAKMQKSFLKLKRKYKKNNNINNKSMKEQNGCKCTSFLGFNRGNYKRYKKNRIKYHNDYNFYNNLSFLSLLFLFVVFSVFLWKLKILITNLTTLMKEDASSKVDNHIGLKFQHLYKFINSNINRFFSNQSSLQNATSLFYNETTKFMGSLKNKSLTIANYVLHNIPIKLKANFDIAILNRLNVTNNVTLG